MKKNILFLLLLKSVFIYAADATPSRPGAANKLANAHKKERNVEVESEKYDELFPALPTGLIATKVVEVEKVGRKMYARVRWQSNYPFSTKEWVEQVREAAKR